MSEAHKALSQRDISPPNSVKAFAQRKRRDTADASTTKSKRNELPRYESYDGGNVSATSLHSNVSIRSLGRSHLSRKGPLNTVRNDSEFSDVCLSHRGIEALPLKTQEVLHIDFLYLEQFVVQDERNHATNRHKAPAIEDVRRHLMRPTTRVDTVTSAKENSPNLHSNVFVHTQLNRFTFFSSALESTIHAPRFGHLIMPGENLKDLFLPSTDLQDDKVWWLDMNNPTEEEIRSICKAFGIHPLTIEDIENQESREKIDIFSTYYFASIRSFRMTVSNEITESEPEPFSVYVIVFRGGCLSFSFVHNSHAAEVRERMTTLREYVTLSSDWICYALIDNIVDAFDLPIKQIEVDTENMDDEVFLARSTDITAFLRRMGDLRKNITGMMRLLGGKADVIRGFTKRCNSAYNITPRIDIGLYLGDIQDHVVTMMSNLHHFEKMLARSHAMFLAQISIDNIIQTRESNRTLSIITVAATVLVPCVMVAGLFGMNVKVPWGVSDDGNDNTHAFFGILGVLVISVLVSLGFAKRVRWI